jgi:GNAT superfamily N-acetyltransferase
VSLPLAPGYTIRVPRPEDADSVQTLTATSDREEFGEDEGYTVEEILDEWSKIDLNHDAWLVFASDGSMAGYAYIRHKRHVRLDVEAYVHPEHFGCGIGTTLVRLSEARAHA